MSDTDPFNFHIEPYFPVDPVPTPAPTPGIDPKTGLPLQIGGLTTKPPPAAPPSAPAQAPAPLSASPTPSPSVPPPVFPAPPRRTIMPPAGPQAEPPPAGMTPPALPQDYTASIFDQGPGGGEGPGGREPGPASGAGQAALRNMTPSTSLPPEVLSMLASLGFFKGESTGDQTLFGEDPRKGLFGTSPPPAF